MDSKFTHLTPSGDPTMVDVTDKKVTVRTATARATMVVADEILEAFADDEIHTKKGPVFQTAVLAGIMGAKRTSDLIPLCHPLGLDNCRVEIQINDRKEIIIHCTAKITSKTGVEMEALTGASVAALTVYDMCKGFSQEILIKEVRLIKKTGGKQDYLAKE